MDVVLPSAESQAHEALELHSTSIENNKLLSSLEPQNPLLDLPFWGEVQLLTNEPLTIRSLDHEQNDANNTTSGNLTRSLDLPLLANYKADNTYEDLTLGSAEVSSNFMTGSEYIESLASHSEPTLHHFETIFGDLFNVKKIERVDDGLLLEEHVLEDALSAFQTTVEMEKSPRNPLSNQDGKILCIPVDAAEMIVSNETWFETVASGLVSSTLKDTPTIGQIDSLFPIENPGTDQTSDPIFINEELGNITTESTFDESINLDGLQELNAGFTESDQESNELLRILEPDILALVSFLKGKQHSQRHQKSFLEFNPTDQSFSVIGRPRSGALQKANFDPDRTEIVNKLAERWKTEGYASLTEFEIAERTKNLMRKKQIRAIDKIFFKECRKKFPDHDTSKSNFLHCPRCEKSYKRQDGARRHFRLKHIEVERGFSFLETSSN